MSDERRVASAAKHPWGGAAALGGVMAFVITVVTLHFLQPGYDPLNQLMSELALGPHGWAMFAAFGGLAAAVFGIQMAIGAAGAPRGFRALLVVASLFFLAAGVFPLGPTSEIHIAAIASAFVLTVLAMYLFPTLAGNATGAAPRLVSWPLAAGVAISAGLSNIVLPMGVGQRLAAAFLLVWLAVVGWRLSRS